MKSGFSAGLLICALAGSAAAETFTFNSTSTTVNSISVATGPSDAIGAGFIEGQSQVTYASGRRGTTQNKCASWSAPPASGFSVNGLCTFSEGDGEEATIQFSCQTDATGQDCWGALRGVSGKRSGKSGTISWRQSANPDGAGAAAGTGMWND
jgi:hypothetical protein